MVTVGLMPQTYTVSEDVGSVSVCIALTGGKVPEFSVPFVVNTTDISAMGKTYVLYVLQLISGLFLSDKYVWKSFE